ncbi:MULTISPECIES: helix-turn-helix transcriptional regulator [Pseudomonas]|uniref:ArsR/SmtB family transcription factor n=1 Tax=Pseudomonas TaxID=286 RepID=UPI000CFF5813|nr:MULTISPECIES: helix-turn-helix domain-containing protein [Pseudomonas]PRA52836.1 transcriptional regulator [Pseudomonas sp. MYb115]QXN49359.1 helix-turn-helix domain-containing protein [Pseudomonas fluorescens]WSO23673.1 helix-turn-helix domain-containing protein [Pseudomonas fluorescens]
MDVEQSELRLANVAAAIADPARARMLCCLLDGRARTATELAVVAQKSPSTASSHFQKLLEQGLVTLVSQGKHRYFQLASADVAKALEGLLSLTSFESPVFKPSTPCHLRHARTCYDHLAGEVGVLLHDALLAGEWMYQEQGDYGLTPKGIERLTRMGMDLSADTPTRRRFAYPCLDWSQRCAHVGGTLGAALLGHMVREKWVVRALDSRALTVTAKGRKRLASAFDIQLEV